MIAESIGKRIRARIEALDMSQTDLAASTGLSVSRLNNYIQGRRPPDAQTLRTLASALQCSTDYLLGAEDTVAEVGRAVMGELLLAEGMEPGRVAALLDAATTAMKILAALPDEGSADLRFRLAARAALRARDH